MRECVQLCAILLLTLTGALPFRNHSNESVILHTIALNCTAQFYTYFPMIAHYFPLQYRNRNKLCQTV